MATTFIFADSFTEKSCACLIIDHNHQVVQGLAERPFDAIRPLQHGTETVVVLSSRHFTFHYVQLPWLGDKKARAALPYALEDQLAQNVDELHFSFDRQHYTEGRYLVVVSARSYLESILGRLQENALDFDVLTVDWFALTPHESCVLPEYLLIHSDTYCGTLTADMMRFLSAGNDQKTYFFTDSPATLIPAEAIATEKNSHLWLAERLLQNKPLDLCQGSLAHGTAKANLKSWIIAAAAMIFIWVTSLITVNWITLHQLNNKMTAIDSQIAVIYRQFFPGAKQVISPRFRITQYLKSNQGTDDQPFWVLLDKLASATATPDIQIEQLRFQNKTLQVTLTTSDFSRLEALQNRLQSDRVAVKQNQASTVEGKVVSTLELNL